MLLDQHLPPFSSLGFLSENEHASTLGSENMEGMLSVDEEIQGLCAKIVSYADEMRLVCAACQGDTVTVKAILSSAGAQSLINHQDETIRATPLYFAAARGQASVVEQLIEACCSIDHPQKN